MSNLKERSGGVNLRLGGQSADFASLVDTLPSGQTEAFLYGTTVPVSSRLRCGYDSLMTCAPATIGIHLRIPYHAREYLVIGQHELVFGYVSFICLIIQFF